MTNFAGGARVTLLAQWVRFAIQVVGFVVLTRLLTPAEFGVVAMVTVIVALAMLVADSGLMFAGIQAADLDEGQRTNLFWLNAAAGAVGMAIVALSGPLLAWFYHDDRVVGLALVISVTLLLNGLAVQFRVAINRQFRFGILALEDVIAAGAGLIVGTLMAVAGAGYWALAGQLVSQSLVLVALAAAQSHWWPGWPRRGSTMGGLVRFGSNNLWVQLMNMVSRTTDAMMVGRLQGAEALGFYSRATQLVNMSFQQLVTPLTRVMLPRLASEQTTEGLNGALLRVQRVIVYVLLGAVSALAAVAHPLTIVFLGAHWAPMAIIVQVLCVGAVFQALGYVYYWAFLAIARTGTLLLSELPGRLLMILGVIVVARWGVLPVAWVMSLGLAVIWATSTVVFAPRAGIDSRRLTAIAVPPIVLFALAFGAAFILQSVWFAADVEDSPLTALVSLAGAWIAVVALGMLVPRVRRDVRAVVADTTRLRRRSHS